MSAVNTFFYHSTPVEENREKDWEDSTLLKIAACVPGIGLLICQMASISLEKKLDQFIPQHRKTGIPEQKVEDYTRAKQLAAIGRDYNKAALVNNVLTIALAVSGLVLNLIPAIVAAIFIGVFSLTATVFTVGLCTTHSNELISAKRSSFSP